MRNGTILLPAVLLALLLVLGCGDSDPSSGSSGASSSTGGDDRSGERAGEAAGSFVPEADQFGIERFKIVYELEGQETGTRTMWVEDHGDRVGLEDDVTVYGEKQRKIYYWDGERGHLKTLPDGRVSSMGLRMKASEPSSFATLPVKDLEMAGYERLGEKEVLGRTCEHWKNDRFNYEGCRYKRIELEFLNGAGTERIVQRRVAIEFVEGEGIPDRIKTLADE